MRQFLPLEAVWAAIHKSVGRQSENFHLNSTSDSLFYPNVPKEHINSF